MVGHHLVARDGTTLLIRRAAADDETALAHLYEDLSPESAYHRFLGFPSRQSPWHDEIKAPGGTACTLVAEAGGGLVGVASYRGDPARPRDAEVAFTVADRWQGRGLGTLLLEQLVTEARAAGVNRFLAETSADNPLMLAVFRDAGFPVTSTTRDGVVEARIALDAAGGFGELHARRAGTAAHESLRPFFLPSGIAVIGASRSPAKVGGQIFRHLRRSGFTGALYPVNASAAEVDGIRAYAKVSDVPGPVDLAVIVVPSAGVAAAVDECLDRQIRALVIITAGFAETGAAGREAEAALLDKVRRAGARMIGPNCMGILNMDPSVRLNATFAPDVPPPGRVSMSTQSGALGLALLAEARRIGLGVASCVSVGNKADVSGNDLLQYWASDPATDVVLMYTESFGNPRKFAEIARRTARHKPIVVLKAGRTQAGLRAASSHTGALATDDVVVDALLHQSGVVRVRTLEELFDTAVAFERAPLPRGRRVGILTNAGGAGILAADACETEGLVVATLDAATVARLEAFLPGAASTANPVDMLASASPEDYGRAIAAMLADSGLDSLIVAYVPPALSDPAEVATAIRNAVDEAKSSKPVIVSFVTSDAGTLSIGRLPTFVFPERAATALARMTSYAEWRRRPAWEADAAPPAAPERLTALMAPALERGGGWLSPKEVDQLLRAIGLSPLRGLVCRTASEAVQAATTLGYPVALKADGPDILHKSDVGGVVLNLADAGSVAATFAGLARTLGTAMTGVLVQEMAPDAPEFLVGATADPLFGPVVALGAGGTLAELVRDVSFRVAPLGPQDVTDMANEIRAARLLRGFRGAQPRDERALLAVVTVVARLVTACPEIVELDLNPVRVYASGALVLDARVRVAPVVARPSTRLEY